MSWILTSKFREILVYIRWCVPYVGVLRFDPLIHEEVQWKWPTLKGWPQGETVKEHPVSQSFTTTFFVLAGRNWQHKLVYSIIHRHPIVHALAYSIINRHPIPKMVAYLVSLERAKYPWHKHSWWSALDYSMHTCSEGVCQGKVIQWHPLKGWWERPLPLRLNQNFKGQPNFGHYSGPPDFWSRIWSPSSILYDRSRFSAQTFVFRACPRPLCDSDGVKMQLHWHVENPTKRFRRWIVVCFMCVHESSYLLTRWQPSPLAGYQCFCDLITAMIL